jgi:hypothetical protein
MAQPESLGQPWRKIVLESAGPLHRRGMLVLLIASTAASSAQIDSSNGTVPCSFNRPFVDWSGQSGSSACIPRNPVPCTEDGDCAALPAACCPHYGPGPSPGCGWLRCLRAESDAASFCGTSSISPGGGGTKDGLCQLGSAYPICAFCNSGPCSAGNAMCASQQMCTDPSPMISLTCYPEGHLAPPPATNHYGMPPCGSEEEVDTPASVRMHGTMSAATVTPTLSDANPHRF